MKQKKTIFLTILSLGIVLLVFSTITNSSLTYSFIDNQNNQVTISSSTRPNWRWTNLELISTESTGTSIWSDIATDLEGNVHVVWSDLTNYDTSGTDRDIFYKKWVNATETWTTTEVVSTVSNLDSFYTALDTDSLGNVYVVWSDLTDYDTSGVDMDIFFRIWDVSSSSWNTSEVVSTESTAGSTRPAIKVDSSGNAYITWQDTTNYDLSGGDIDIFYKKWDTNTQSFSITEVVSLISSGNSEYSSITADEQGNVYCVWLDQTFRNPDRDLMLNKFDEQSGLWSGTELLNDYSSLSYWTSNDINIDFQGNLHVVAKGEGATNEKLVYYKWNSETENWLDPEVLSSAGTMQSPSIVSDALGNLYVFWSSYSNILFRH